MNISLFKRRSLTLSLCLVSYISISSCQTSKVSDFNQVILGQEKHDVLETIGNPNRIARVGSEDRWFYDMYDEKQMKLERAVHFFEGHVVYKGEPVQPFISAELQDKINEKKNIELSKKELKKAVSNQ